MDMTFSSFAAAAEVAVMFRSTQPERVRVQSATISGGPKMFVVQVWNRDVKWWKNLEAR